MIDFETLKWQAVISEAGIDRSAAMSLAEIPADQFLKTEFLEITQDVANTISKKQIQKCSDGFTSNQCANNCKYCFLSKRNWQYSHKNNLLPAVLKNPEDFLQDATEKEKLGVTHYKIVGTCSKIPDREFNMALEAYKLIKRRTNLTLCASMGLLNEEQLSKLKRAGVENINFNFETSPERFNQLGTQFTFKDKLDFNLLVAKMGLKRCSGILVGLGETMAQRIELGILIKRLGIESMPFNIYVSTPAFRSAVPKPEDLIKTLIILRLMLPKTQIIVNNGNIAFGKLFPFIFKAGANGFGARYKSYLEWSRNI